MSQLEAAVRRAIADAEARTPGAAESWPAALALTLAQEIETAGKVPLAARVAATKELRATMELLTGPAESKPAGDRIDDLLTRRQKRRGVA